MFQSIVDRPSGMAIQFVYHSLHRSDEVGVKVLGKLTNDRRSNAAFVNYLISNFVDSFDLPFYILFRVSQAMND